MVVIGIISIVGVLVIPGFKKAYDSYKIKETYDKINTAMSSMRAFYLIYNEPSFFDGGAAYYVDARMDIFLPMGWINTRASTHHWGITIPYHDYHELSLPKLYLFTSSVPVFRFGNFYLNLYSKPRPYYFDDFLEMCRQKEYIVSESGYDLYIYLPEKHSNSWFL